MVGSGPLLQHESGRQDATGGTVQRGTKISFLGIFLEHRGTARERSRALVPGVHSVESALLAIYLHSRSSRCGAVHNWTVPDSPLHGRGCGARVAWLCPSRRCLSCRRPTLPSRWI